MFSTNSTGMEFKITGDVVKYTHSVQGYYDYIGQSYEMSCAENGDITIKLTGGK